MVILKIRGILTITLIASQTKKRQSSSVSRHVKRKMDLYSEDLGKRLEQSKIRRRRKIVRKVSNLLKK